MKNKDDFYIGWQDKMPESNKKPIKKLLITIFAVLTILVVSLVIFQKPFNDHIFDLGKTQNITGVYYNKPVPFLIAEKDDLPDNISNNILLVGYGKFGAEETMDRIQKKDGNLNGKKITLEGTLISGDNVSLMELTKKENSLVAKFKDKIKADPVASPSINVILDGEILDPKCYFGVMKPGEGKIHKSCAIRCISGGIPPVFRRDSNSSNKGDKYFLLLDQDGKTMNKKILEYVAEDLRVEGMTYKVNGWNILKVNINRMSLIDEEI